MLVTGRSPVSFQEKVTACDVIYCQPTLSTHIICEITFRYAVHYKLVAYLQVGRLNVVHSDAMPPVDEISKGGNAALPAFRTRCS